MQKETLAAASSSSSSSSSSDFSPPEDAWVDTYQRLLPQWQSFVHSSQIQSPAIPVSISRVNQVDAARLDIEMSAMLKEQLVKVFTLMKPGLLFQYEPELDAFLEFLIWRFSIWVDKPTPGNALMNLRYRDERMVPTRGKQVRTGLEGPGLTVSQKIWYCLATVGGQYVWARLQSFSAFRRWGDSDQRSMGRQAWGLIHRVEGFYKAASLLNLLIFLYTGRYRNLIERALRARLVYGSPNMNRAVSFEYMNRQLVWNEFSEMLLLLLPLLNSSSVRKFLPFSKDKSSDSAAEENACPICLANPTIPFFALPCQHRQSAIELWRLASFFLKHIQHIMGVKHYVYYETSEKDTWPNHLVVTRYCYYCLRTRCAASMSFRCTRCNEPVIAMQRYGGSIVDKPSNN